MSKNPRHKTPKRTVERKALRAAVRPAAPSELASVAARMKSSRASRGHVGDLRSAAKRAGVAFFTPERGLEDGRGPVLMRRADFERMRALAEDTADLRDLRGVDATHARHDYISAEGMRALIAGESPVKVWRKERALTQVELAKRTKISQSHLAEIERGRKKASVSTIRALAKALHVEPGDLI